MPIVPLMGKELFFVFNFQFSIAQASLPNHNMTIR